MKLRKLVSMAMAGVMAVSLATCGGPDTAKTTAVDAATTAEVETTAAAEDAKTKETEASEAPAADDIAEEDSKIGFVYIGDGNEDYTAAHHNGATEVKEKLGLNGDQIIIKWNIPEDETAKDAAIDLADQGCQVMFANSFGHESYVVEAAKGYPDVQFCHATGSQAASSDLSNMHNYLASIYESRYISGVVAGLKLNQMIEGETVKADVCKVGYAGAYPYAEVISGCTSFFLGVRSVYSDTTMEVKYTNSWASFDLKKEAADALTSDGCVLVNQYADTTSVPAACEAIGVSCVDCSISVIATTPKQALTSASNNWAAYMTETVQHVINETEISVDWCEDLSGGAMLITELNGAAVTPETKEKVDEVKTKLASGELHVSDTSTRTVGGGTLDTYKKDGSDTEYISDGYFHESEFGSAPAFDILIDGITTIDN